jgi:hypothetical protein
MVRCPFRAEAIIAQAPLCRYCGRPVPAGCERIDYIGRRFNLGRLFGGGYGVWDPTLGSRPIRVFPASEEGRWAAHNFYSRLEQDLALAITAKTSRRRARAVPVSVVLLLLVIAFAYYFIHERRYDGCLIKPGLFSWPSACF